MAQGEPKILRITKHTNPRITKHSKQQPNNVGRYVACFVAVLITSLTNQAMLIMRECSGGSI